MAASNWAEARLSSRAMTITAASDVMNQIPEETTEANAVLVPALNVTGATVIATSYSTSDAHHAIDYKFWLLTVHSASTVSGLYGPDTSPFDIQVGRKISFTVTEVGRYFDSPQIRKLAVTSTP